MNVDQLLKRHGLTRDTAARYIDAITRMNQSETAEELEVARDTIHRYKKEFAEMTATERSLLIASLTQEQFLERVSKK